METTKWEEYGVASGNPKCANCMVSCGYEPTAVLDGFHTLEGFWAMVKGNFLDLQRRACAEAVERVAFAFVDSAGADHRADAGA